MDRDHTKLFLLVSLALLVIVLCIPGPRPLAPAPLAGDEPVGESQGEQEQRDLVSRGPGFANVPSNAPVPPLSLMMPVTGSQGGIV